VSFLKRFFLVLLILLLPSQLGFHFWPSWSLVSGIRVDYLSPTVYLTDVISVILVMLFRDEVQLIPSKLSLNTKKKLIVLGLFIALNIVFSTIPALSLYRWLRISLYILLASLLLTERKVVRALFVNSIPVTLFWTCVLALFQIAQRGSLNGVLYWLGERRFTVETPGIALSKLMPFVSLRPYATLPHPNVLAGVILVLWLMWVILHKNKTGRFWYITCLVAVVILFTESYSAWLAIGFCGLFFLFAKVKVGMSTYLQKVLLLCVVFVSLLSPILFSFASIDVGSRIGKNTRERIALAIEAGFIGSQSPVLGSGLGTFVTKIPGALEIVPQTFITGVTSLLQPVHNIPLLVFAEMGGLGILLCISLFFSIPFTAPVIAILVISLFDHYWMTLNQPLLVLLFLFVLHPYLTKPKP